MEILEAFDLTGSYRDAGELAGCSHHTVKAWVTRRNDGLLPVGGEVVERPKLIDPFLPKVEEWVERSRGRVRADVVFERLVPLGFGGSERTVRRAVAVLKASHRRGARRVYRPWVPEPGLWALCGSPHSSQYAAPVTMRRCGPRAGVAFAHRC